jgi:hypothetical protein
MATFDRRLPLVVALLGAASYVAMQRLEARGAIAVVALWGLSLPILLRPLRAAMRRELLGVVFLFATAAYVEVLDDVLATQRAVSSAILVVGLLYLARRWRTVAEVARSPVMLLFALFFAQQIASAFLFGNPAALGVLENRASVLLTLLGAATLARRPGGDKLVPAVVVVATLASVPVMLRELADPGVIASLFSDGPLPAETRSGGLYAQANNAGIALTFALGFALALKPRLSTLVAIVLALGTGIVCAASRGAFSVFLLLLAATALGARLRSVSPRALGRTLAVAAVGLVLLRPTAALLARGAASMEEQVPSVARLEEVLAALSGSTAELTDDDSQRSDIAAESIRMIGERPLLGRGTGNFFVAEKHQDFRSHVQFLEVLGENGLVGGVIYGALLAAAALSIRRAPVGLRFSCALVLGAWFLTHFDNHNLVEYRFLVLPPAFVCGVARSRPALA